MCRMFAVVADQPCAHRERLLDAANCLLRQSCGDHRGDQHHDGWGIGSYEQGEPHLVRSPLPARDDADFHSVAASIVTDTLFAHVRQASVGVLSSENCHPFAWERWLLMHNGTIVGFEQVAPRMRAEMSPERLSLRRGATDSELLFHWLLARGDRAGFDWHQNEVDLPRLVELVAVALRELTAWSAAAPPDPKGEPIRLNLLLTNGSTLLATRWHYELHYSERPGVTIVASEPLDEGPWRELPEPSILSFRRGGVVQVNLLAEPAETTRAS